MEVGGFLILGSEIAEDWQNLGTLSPPPLTYISLITTLYVFYGFISGFLIITIWQNLGTSLRILAKSGLSKASTPSSVF